MQPSHQTLLTQAGHYIDQVSGGITPPIHLSSTFARDEHYQLRGDFIYGRYQNPNAQYIENLAAQLDNGVEAMAFSSGMSAITALLETFLPGDHIVAPSIMYHGAQDWLQRISDRRNVNVTFFDPTDPNGLALAIENGRTTMVWIETPVNPTWDVIDIQKTAEIASEAGAFLVVDATVSTPITTMALDFGADIVFHSATKYLNGHSDLMAGILVTRLVDERWEEIKLVRKYVGGVLPPMDAWLLLRGMRTLGIRFERISENALAFSQHFEQDKRIEKVLYPGLVSHPGHKIAQKQMSNGYGGMVSILISGGAEEAVSVIKRLKLFIPATSLGGVESLVEHRASVEGPHSKVPKNLLRFSIGTESIEDLIEDMEQALATSSDHR